MSPIARFRLLVFFLALAGLAFYLWPALAAPVVLWSDSGVDLAWAKSGVGIFRPIPLPPPGVPIGHLPKPGYLLFLRLAMGALPWLGEPRSVVVVQSVILALSILATSFWIGHRRGRAVGLALACCCFLFLRLRDSSSAVMSEALAAAVLLPIAALLLEPPKRFWASPMVGLSAGALFLVRPNCGALILLVALTSWIVCREGKRLLLVLAGFTALALPFWHASRAHLPGDPLHGLGFQIVEGSADYYWALSIHPWPAGRNPAEAAIAQIQTARKNWAATLAADKPDRGRQLVWRSFHGLFGIEYYDSRWSPTYAALTTASRLLSPFLILASIATLLVAPLSRSDPSKLAGLLLLLLIVGQDLLLGSNPRYVLPFLPVVLLFAIGAAPRLARGPRRRAALGIAFVGFLFCARWQRHVLNWQWGRVERAGVTLLQRIPAKGLPSRAPATLHLRIAAPDPSCGANWILSASGRVIATSERERDRREPVVAVAIPDWLIEENRRRPIEISLLSKGSFSDTSYLLFPVIPPPWTVPARRVGSSRLSPATGVAWGALDWWAHEGSHD